MHSFIAPADAVALLHNYIFLAVALMHNYMTAAVALMPNYIGPAVAILHVHNSTTLL